MARVSESPGRQSSSTSQHRGLPASPTLTNPDMILPDYHDPDSPPQQLHRQSGRMWNNGHVSDMEFQMTSPDPFIAGPVTPTTPIIYGNGTMLSDIGEVTEIESNAGVGNLRKTSLRYTERDDVEDDGGVLRSSPTMGQPMSQAWSRNSAPLRRVSVGSTDTVTEHDKVDRFVNMDDSVSVEDSNFQGDDEESVVSSFIDDDEGDGVRGTPVRNQNDVGRERPSTNAISKRAEQILANAKRRLTTMEGNLSRARSSLTNSTLSDGSTPSPPTTAPAAGLRASTKSVTPSHSRNTSFENTTTGNLRPFYMQRSASALGAAGGYRQPAANPRSDRGPRAPVYRISQQPSEGTMERLEESIEEELHSVNEVVDRRGSTNSTGLFEASSNTYLEGGKGRSASVVQMRGLQDQMNGLKGKISSLREQALADSLKRRSLQSLRTPSPFTHARFENGLMEPRDIKRAESNTPISTEPIRPPPPDVQVYPQPLDDKEPCVLDDKAAIAIASDAQAVNPDTAEETHTQEAADLDHDEARHKISHNDRIVHHDEEATTSAVEHEAIPVYSEGELEGEGTNTDSDEHLKQLDTSEDEDSGQDQKSEAGESTYHDVHQSLSHEDREDAFDYEHFFLHSAMGTLNGHDYGRSTDSWSSTGSEESAETTRVSSRNRERRTSLDTISSVNTFATATEGRASRSSAGRQTEGREPSSPQYDHSEELPDTAKDVFGIRNVGMSEWHENTQRPNSIVHRPSVSSFESTGTTRSFPLVKKAATNGATLSQDGSPEPPLNGLSRVLLSEVAGILDGEGTMDAARPAPVQALTHHDQIAVQMLVASLSKCISGLGSLPEENMRTEDYRRRIEAARRMLEGQDE